MFKGGGGGWGGGGGGGGVSVDILRKFLFRVSSLIVRRTRSVNVFGGFESYRPPGAGVASRPNMGAENWNFLAENHDCGGSMASFGFLELQDTLFFEIG